MTVGDLGIPNAEVIALSSCMLGTSAVMLSILVFARCKAQGHGWCFPLAVSLCLSGVIQLLQAISIFKFTQPWVNPTFTRPVENLFADCVLILGCFASWYRMHRRLPNMDAIFSVLVFACCTIIMLLILWWLHLNAEVVLAAVTPAGPRHLNIDWLSILFPILLLGCASLFVGVNLLYTFLIVYATGAFVASLGFADKNVLLHLFGQAIRFAAYFWFFYWVAHQPSGNDSNGTDSDQISRTF